MRTSPQRSRFWPVGRELRFATGQKRVVACQQDWALCCHDWFSWFSRLDAHQSCALHLNPNAFCHPAANWQHQSGGQARWQRVVERDAATFKGLSHFYCIQIVHVWMRRVKAHHSSKLGNKSWWGIWTQLLVSIKHPFSGLPSIQYCCICFSLVLFFFFKTEKVFVVLQVLLQQSVVAARGGNQGRHCGLRHFPTGFLKWKNHADMWGPCF